MRIVPNTNIESAAVGTLERDAFVNEARLHNGAYIAPNTSVSDRPHILTRRAARWERRVARSA